MRIELLVFMSNMVIFEAKNKFVCRSTYFSIILFIILQRYTIIFIGTFFHKKNWKYFTENKNGHFKMSNFKNPKYFCDFFYQKSYVVPFFQFSVTNYFTDFKLLI